MKKFSKAAKQDFIAKIRKTKPAKGRGGVGGRQPVSKRVPNADGPGGALP